MSDGAAGAGTSIEIRRPGSRTWEPLSRDSASTSSSEADEYFDATIRTSFTKGHLSVLLGLGTSLGLSGRGRKAPTMRDLYAAASSLPSFDRAAACLRPKSARDDIEALLSACSMSLSLRPDANMENFVQLAEQLIVEHCNFVDEDTDLSSHRTLLRKVGRRSPRLPRARFFTTNYDLSLEYAARSGGFTLIDGFGLGGSPVFDGSFFDYDIVRREVDGSTALASNVAHLYKLHGSIDWRQLPAAEIARGAAAGAPVLIYPSSDKYQQSYKPPYVELMSRFQQVLRERDVTLIISGFGFNDEHIVAPILAALRTNVSMRLIVADPILKRPLEELNAPLRTLIEMSDANDERILLAYACYKDFASRLPDLSPPDAAELHRARWTEARR